MASIPAKTSTVTTDPHPNVVQTIVIGLSGPSSSGKTTLARLLRSIFNFSLENSSGDADGVADSGGHLTPRWTVSLFILHQDDFYKTDQDIPHVTVSSEAHGTRTLQDWDCVESLDLPLFESTLTHVRDHGSLPPDAVSKEDQNAVGDSGVSEDTVDRLRSEVRQWFTKRVGDLEEEHGSGGRGGQIRICILDGFLLYPPPPSVPSSAPHSPELSDLYRLTHSLLSPRLFLPSTRAHTLQRRLARSGYVTLEGFWTDPPGYVEDVVWPNYARDHAWMYVDGQVDDSDFALDVCAREGISVCPGGGSWPMHDILDWGVQQIQNAMTGRMTGGLPHS